MALEQFVPGSKKLVPPPSVTIAPKFGRMCLNGTISVEIDEYWKYAQVYRDTEKHLLIIKLVREDAGTKVSLATKMSHSRENAISLRFINNNELFRWLRFEDQGTVCYKAEYVKARNTITVFLDHPLDARGGA